MPLATCVARCDVLWWRAKLAEHLLSVCCRFCGPGVGILLWLTENIKLRCDCDVAIAA